jgi:hypothetical protein
MWIVAIAWMYVAVMMALAEATNPQGTVLGAMITFVFYGLAPVALVMYLLATPMRRKARLATEAAEAAEAAQQAALTQSASDSGGQAQPDAGSLATGDAIAPERKEP